MAINSLHSIYFHGVDKYTIHTSPQLTSLLPPALFSQRGVIPLRGPSLPLISPCRSRSSCTSTTPPLLPTHRASQILPPLLNSGLNLPSKLLICVILSGYSCGCIMLPSCFLLSLPILPCLSSCRTKFLLS
jgi:hypothetical protein